MAQPALTSSDRRIVIVGTSCSGKTTLAGQLAEALRLEHVEMDALFWKANWQARPIDEFRDMTTDALTCEGWVSDGNFAMVRDIVWGRATTIIWLNYSFPTVFGRAVRRSVQRIVQRTELYSGNRESFRKTFLSSDSILLWVLQTYHKYRREYSKILAEPEVANLNVLEMRNPTQAESLLRSISG